MNARWEDYQCQDIPASVSHPERERENDKSIREDFAFLGSSERTDVTEQAVALSPKTLFVKDSKRREQGEAAREFEGLLWGNCLSLFFFTTNDKSCAASLLPNLVPTSNSAG